MKKQNKTKHRISAKRALKDSQRRKEFKQYMFEFDMKMHTLRFRDWRNEKKVSN